MTTHENEYHDNMVTMLELIWGPGYMAPGGPGNVERLLRGTHPAGKRILDVGCGIGGPAFEMAATHGAEVVGIDLEAPLVDRARRSAAEKGLQNQCRFETVERGPFAFDDQSFDIVLSSGAITQSGGTGALVAECFRVLRPGGFLTCYEWMRTPEPYSDDMLYWFEIEGLTYELQTLEYFENTFRAAGFTGVETNDASDWYREECRREYELIKGDLYASMIELLGREDADHFVENWRAMTVVCDSGEMRQGYCRGRRPS